MGIVRWRQQAKIRESWKNRIEEERTHINLENNKRHKMSDETLQ